MRRPERLAALVALVLGLLHWWLAPLSGTDLAAQLARASFAREAPFSPVDFSWYGGMHPYGYSLLSPWIMALLGVQLSGLLAAVGGSILWARLVRTSERPTLSALLGAVFLTANVVSGRTTFALGALAGLAALVALPRTRRVAGLAVLTALLSPVAAAFLGFAAAVLVLHRRPGGWTLGLAASVPVVVLALLFPGGGVQPFSGSSARPAVIVALVLAALTSAPLVRTGAVLYAVAVVVFAVHDDPFGSNVLRLGLLVAAAVLVASVRGRPRLVALACAGFLSWQVGPTSGDLRAEEGASTLALAAQLEQLGSRRAEVLAPLDHRESWELAERVNLARGWARQQDYVLNPLFYKGNLDGPTYLAWLRDRGVDYVAHPLQGRVDFGSTRESALLEDHVEGLEQVWSDAGWRLLRVVDPAPVAEGIVSATRTQLVFAANPGNLEVKVRWSRWLSVSGPACVERRGDYVLLRVAESGRVVLTSSLRPQGHC